MVDEVVRQEAGVMGAQVGGREEVGVRRSGFGGMGMRKKGEADGLYRDSTLNGCMYWMYRVQARNGGIGVGLSDPSQSEEAPP
jgi:hypothetical protein